MKRALRISIAIGLLVPVIALSGCLFNIFQTAQMVQSGDVSLLIGSGVIPLNIDGEATAWSLTPQARLAFGLSDTINFGLHTGAMIALSTGEPLWLGATGDFKFSIVDNPESLSLAAGFGGGYGAHLLGWGIFGSIFLDLNVIPLYFAYQPIYPIGGGGLLHDVAAGLVLTISENAQLYIEVATRNFQIPSYAIGFEIGL